MTTSVIPAVIDYLVGAAQNSPALVGVSVFDGPQPPAATQSLPQVLWIGADPMALQDPAGQADQVWPVMDHARTRDEDGSIACSAQHWSGDTTNKVHRDGAAAIIAGLDDLIRGDPDAGGPGDASMGGLVFWSGILGPYAWYPRQVANGALMLVTFHVVFHARLYVS
jgi:hypothetical protein